MKIREQQLDLRLASNDNADRAPIRFWLDERDPWADNFAGGGGVGEALKQLAAELGLKKQGADIAVNHWDAALAMHEANHPTCEHHCEDITKFDPVAAARGRRYALAWFSPTCVYFSQAKGGPLDVEATKVRGLAWMMSSWAASTAKPRVAVLENVKQFEHWGPLHRTHNNGCSFEIAAAAARMLRNGKVKPRCLKNCHYMTPIKKRRGHLFQAFVKRMRKHYRYVEWRVLKAHHYGSPTSRERGFLICSDTPPSWPTPTHGHGLEPYRTAAECIDWHIACPSIFGRKRDLAPATQARIRAGFDRFVLRAARPFVVHVTHGARAHDVDAPAPTVTGANRGELGVISPMVLKAKTYGGGGNDAKLASEPLGTLTTSKRGEHAIAAPVVIRAAHGDVDATGKRRGIGAHNVTLPLATITNRGSDFAIATPYLAHVSNGERREVRREDGGTSPAQAPRIYDVQAPLGTIVAQGIKHGVVAPYLVKNYSERDGGFAGGADVARPLGTITAQDHHSLALPHLIKLHGTSAAHIEASAHGVDEPLDTISAGGTHHALTMAYIVRYNGMSDGQAADVPLSTIDTKDRFAVVELTLERDVCDKARRVAAFLGYEHPIVLEIDGVEWVLVDIGFRMLVPRELFLCQGFPKGYNITPLFRGKPLTKTAQTKCVGNSIPPQLAKAVARAALMTIRYEPEMRMMA